MNIMNINKFIEYLKSKGFPEKKYDITKLYPRKYKKFILYDSSVNNIKNSESNTIFKSSIPYISTFQKKLMMNNIENCIGGGFSTRLYIEDSVNNSNKNILITKDVDMILFYKNVYTLYLIERLIRIINSAYESIKSDKLNKLQKGNTHILKLFSIINYENKEQFTEILNIFFKNGFDLSLYKPDLNNNVYILWFIKKINNNLYIKINVKIGNIQQFIKNNIYNFSVLTYVSLLNNREKNIYLPTELFVLNKNNLNIKLSDIKNTFIKDNIEVTIYNERFLIYNLLHICHNYIYNIDNNRIKNKISKGKNKRDRERLFYLIKVYLNKYYLITDKKRVKMIYDYFMENLKKCGIYMFKVDTLDIIDNSIKKLID